MCAKQPNSRPGQSLTPAASEEECVRPLLTLSTDPALRWMDRLGGQSTDGRTRARYSTSLTPIEYVRSEVQYPGGVLPLPVSTLPRFHATPRLHGDGVGWLACRGPGFSELVSCDGGTSIPTAGAGTFPPAAYAHYTTHPLREPIDPVDHRRQTTHNAHTTHNTLPNPRLVCPVLCSRSSPDPMWVGNQRIVLARLGSPSPGHRGSGRADLIALGSIG